jgi:hypothetical protein
MSDDEWSLWCVSDAERNAWQDGADPCDDCLAGFAVEMRAAGRCDGSPKGYEADPTTPIRSLTRSEAMQLRWRDERFRTHMVAVLAEANRRRDVAAVREDVLRFRRMGMTFKEAGRQLGISKSAAHYAVYGRRKDVAA